MLLIGPRNLLLPPRVILPALSAVEGSPPQADEESCRLLAPFVGAPAVAGCAPCRGDPCSARLQAGTASPPTVQGCGQITSPGSRLTGQVALATERPPIVRDAPPLTIRRTRHLGKRVGR